MTNNMTEIKQSKIKLFIGWIVSHAVSIGLIGIGLALFLSSCGKAKAAEAVPDNLSDLIAEDVSNIYDPTLADTVVNNLQSVFSTCPNVIRVEFDSDRIVYFFMRSYCMGVHSGSSHTVGYTYDIDVPPNYYNVVFNTSNVPTSINNCYYTLFIYSGGYVCYGYNESDLYPGGIDYTLYGPVFGYTNNTNVLGTNLGNTARINYWYRSSISRFEYFRSNAWTNFTLNLSRVQNYVSNFDFYFCDDNNNWAFSYSENWDDVYPPSVEDDRLKITTVNDVYGQKNLFIDIRDFIDDFPISDTSGSSNWLDNDTLILTLVRDMIPEEVRLNSTNSNIKSKYIFETPYSFFNVSDDEDLYISDVSFSISGSGQSVPLTTESYNILCEYWLNEVYTRPSQDNIPIDGDVSGDVLSSEEKHVKQYLVDFNQGYGLTFSEYQSLDKPDFFEDDAYFIYLSDGGTLADLINILFPNDVAHAIIEYIDNIDTDIKLQQTIEDYLAHNAYTQMCSMIVFVWIEDWTDFTAGTISSDELTYYYYVTTFGRLKQVNQQLADLYVSSKQIEKNTSATYSYLYDKLNDFENMTLEAIWGNNHFSIFTNLNKLDNDLLSSVSRIISAMPTFTPYDDHDVVYELGVLQGLLETIIENQKSPTDGYPRYISWIKNFDDLDGFGNWSDSVLNTFKNIYLFFNYREDINVMETGLQSYVFYVDEFVRMLLGNTQSDLEIETRYYMSIFNDTYDVHNINGGGS